MKNKTIIQIISKNIHDIRISKNISLKELAVKSEIDIEFIKQLGSGTCLELGPIIYSKIANGLGVNLKDITKGIEFVED